MKAVAMFGTCVVIMMIIVVTEVTGQGSSYIRWGRTVCPTGAELVYNGYMAGSHHHATFTGSGSNYLCLTGAPQYGSHSSTSYDWNGRIFVVDFQFYTNNAGGYDPFSHDNNGGSSLTGGVAPCAVCYVPRSAQITIQPSKSCPRGWTKEYNGYIASSYHHHTKSEFVCIDDAPETLGQRTSPNDYGVSLMYPVWAGCTPVSFGKCDKILSQRELTCAVCTRS